MAALIALQEKTAALSSCSGIKVRVTSPVVGEVRVSPFFNKVRSGSGFPSFAVHLIVTGDPATISSEAEPSTSTERCGCCVAPVGNQLVDFANMTRAIIL